MTQYLRNLMEELGKTEVNPTLEPTDEVKPGETIVGEMSDDLKRMNTLYAKVLAKDYALQTRAAEIIREIIAGTKFVEQRSAEMATLNSEKMWIVEEAKALLTNFWISLLTEFPALRGKTNIVFRRGWKVVLTSASPEGEVCPDCGGIRGVAEENSMEMPEAQSEEPDGSNFFGLNLN